MRKEDLGMICFDVYYKDEKTGRIELGGLYLVKKECYLEETREFPLIYFPNSYLYLIYFLKYILLLVSLFLWQVYCLCLFCTSSWKHLILGALVTYIWSFSCLSLIHLYLISIRLKERSSFLIKRDI